MFSEKGNIKVFFIVCGCGVQRGWGVLGFYGVGTG